MHFPELHCFPGAAALSLDTQWIIHARVVLQVTFASLSKRDPTSDHSVSRQKTTQCHGSRKQILQGLKLIPLHVTPATSGLPLILMRTPEDKRTQRTQHFEELTHKSKEPPIAPFVGASPSDCAPSPWNLDSVICNAPSTSTVLSRPSNPAKRLLLNPARTSARKSLEVHITYASLQMTKVKCCKPSKGNMH